MAEEQINELFEKYIWAYEILGLDIDSEYTDTKIKKAYRSKVKEFHPDNQISGDEVKFKEISFAYELIANQIDRKIFQKLKENSHKWRKNTKKEKANPYIFQRRDGSKIEIQPQGQIEIDNKKIFVCRLIQYYKDITYINEIFARINWKELMSNPEYCDFFVNNYLSKTRVENSCNGYSRYLGYIEAAKSRGRIIYRIAEDDMFIDINQMKLNDENYISFYPNGKDYDSEDFVDMELEKCGEIVLKDKVINQYNFFSESLNMNSVIYGDIDIKRMKKDSEYKNKICQDVLNEKNLRKCIAENGGYIGSYEYNPIDNDYDIIIDTAVRDILVKKSKKKER